MGYDIRIDIACSSDEELTELLEHLSYNNYDYDLYKEDILLARFDNYYEITTILRDRGIPVNRVMFLKNYSAIG